MARTRLVGALGALVIMLAVGLVASSWPVGAQEPPPAQPRAVWAGGLYAFMKIDASTGAILVDRTEETPYSIAVDDRRSRVWVRQSDLLTEFDFTGIPLRSLAVGGVGPLDVDTADGSLWVGAYEGSELQLQHRDVQGQLLASAALPALRIMEVVDLDAPRGRVWVLLRQIGGTSAELQAYDLAGQLVQTVTVPDSYSCDLAVEPDTGKLWVATNAGAQRYSSTGILELDILFPPRPLQVILGCPRSVAPDGEGGAWVAARAGAVALVG